MILSRFVSRCCRAIPISLLGLYLSSSPFAAANAITIDFTADIMAGNSIDTGDVFGEGFDANLKGQVIVGSVTIDPVSMTELCRTGAACYGDFGAGSISVSFTIHGITSTTVSTGTMGYFGNRSGGSVSISDLKNSGYNYLAVGAASPDGMVQQSIGVLFNNRTLFSAYGGGNPIDALDSLARIGSGAGLVAGGITFMGPTEHLDATITSIEAVPEPASLALVGGALVGLMLRRRTFTGSTGVSRQAIYW